MSLLQNRRRVFKDDADALSPILINLWVYTLDVVCGGRCFVLVGQNPVANRFHIWLDTHNLAYILFLKRFAHLCVITLMQSFDILALHQCAISELYLFGV